MLRFRLELVATAADVGSDYFSYFSVEAQGNLSQFHVKLMVPGVVFLICCDFQDWFQPRGRSS